MKLKKKNYQHFRAFRKERERERGGEGGGDGENQSDDLLGSKSLLVKVKKQQS
jgi:hypothetical protein